MVEKLGQVAFEQPRRSFLGEGIPDVGAREYSEETAREIDCAVRELTTAAREKALAILGLNRSQLEQGAALLLEKETLLTGEIPPPLPFEDEAVNTPPGKG